MKTGAVALENPRSRVADFVALTKPRLNLLVLLTTTVCFYLALPGTDAQWLIVPTLIGTALVAGGAAALNQVYERDADGLMLRTRSRPLPDGRLSEAEARRFGIALSVAGIAALTYARPLAAGLALGTLVSYALVYTPLKKRTSFAMVVGAVPGALPATLGWAAASGAMTVEAWVLFGIVFFWQIPHFLAVAWMYRDDFARAGFAFLPVIEPSGRRTARHVLLYLAALLPVSLAPTWIGMVGTTYLVGASLLGLGFAGLAVRFAWDRSGRNARWLFLGSIAYLPLLWALLVATRFLG
ncbi:MAG: heme o synthase [Vicinamibacterales bacterium]|jgi:protoheme IX farnesyltransferase|nr:protoheme IX farnesyltransferase [Acidobacteriota bacterium]MDP7294526.1 heme o synthase [Vicinamibacterales bacterium]MDP7471897.1 heme o synthase [Vicinamibacterales bacterium]MDP7672293.1 heme o synthase [Vicinamibacterales bacterium]HJO37922.1 heme o synthase [Vicinamibacterales bacterium]|tara:strand:- start:3064 stop:3954 length:891 start_codon:yes stop_codon:yes gene_type:complete